MKKANTTKRYNLSEIMKRAWELKKKPYRCNLFRMFKRSMVRSKRRKLHCRNNIQNIHWRKSREICC